MKRKFLSVILCLVLLVFTVAFVTACNQQEDASNDTDITNNNTGSNGDTNNGSENDQPSNEVINFEGLVFSDAIYLYDGTEHSISVVGAPDGASVTYSPSNVQSEIGVYEITATIAKENYNTVTLAATLTIIAPDEKEDPIVSVGLEFTSNGDGTCYVSGIGECEDSVLGIPEISPAGDKVIAIGESAFEDCLTINEVIIPETVVTIGESAFEYAMLLRNVVLPEGIQKIDQEAFFGCISLISITLPSTLQSVGTLAFEECFKLVEIINNSPLDLKIGARDYGYLGFYAKEIHNGATKIKKQGDYLFYTYEDTNYLIGYVGNDKNLELPKSYNEEFYDIYDCAFGCSFGVTSISVPYGVRNIGMAAFIECSDLENVIIPDSINSIGEYVFEGCYNVKYSEYSKALYIGNESNPYLALIAFKEDNNSNDSNLNILSISIGASTKIISKGVLCDHHLSITSITVDEENPSYKSIDGNLYSKDGKVIIKYANAKTETSFIIPDSVTRIEKGAFQSSQNLESISIPDSVDYIGDFAFQHCSNLVSVAIPKNVTFIPEWAFSYCVALTSFIISDNVTSIGNGAFNNCCNLVSINIPRGVTSIGDFAFSLCSKLSNVIIPESVSFIGEGAFEKCDVLKIYCEAESQPIGWSVMWNGFNCPVIFGYKAIIDKNS